MVRAIPDPTRRRLLRGATLGMAALAGSARAAGGEQDDLQGAPGMPYAAFDRLPFEAVQIGDALIRVAFGPGTFDLPRLRIIEFVRQSARSVAVYFGRFPAHTARLLVLNTTGPGRPVRSGTAFGHGGAAIKLTLSANVSAAELDRDWILVHEMSHLALPSLPRRQHWFEEGMASYVEPLARAQAGLLGPERVWGDMLAGLPQGLPRPGDQGLDHTPTWGRTYWGGALFCLLADIEIRETTDGQRGLQHALRAVLAHGNIERESAIGPLLEIGDSATGTGVLASLYARMRDRPHPVDLDRLWARLGVRAAPAGVEFDASAPLAALRAALTRRL
jgi:hypothetical protein